MANLSFVGARRGSTLPDTIGRRGGRGMTILWRFQAGGGEVLNLGINLPPTGISIKVVPGDTTFIRLIALRWLRAALTTASVKSSRLA